MADAVRRVLRRKKQVLWVNLSVNEILINKMKAGGLLNEAECRQLMGMISEAERFSKLLDILQTLNSTEFIHFCDLLGAELDWLSNELKSEVMAETGSLHVEDLIRDESEMIVHKHFGTSRRLSEYDKKKIAELLSLKTQAAKNIWKRQLEKTETSLEQKSTELDEIHKKLRSTNTKLEQFLRYYSDQLFDTYHSMHSTSEVLLAAKQGHRKNQDLIVSVDEHMETILRRMHVVISERKTLIKEKEKCLKQLKAETKGANLEDVIKIWTEKHRRDREEQEKTIKSLRKKIANLELMVNDDEKKIERMKVELENFSKNSRLVPSHTKHLSISGESINKVTNDVALTDMRERRGSDAGTFSFPQITRESKSAVTRRWVFYGDTLSK